MQFLSIPKLDFIDLLQGVGISSTTNENSLKYKGFIYPKTEKTNTVLVVYRIHILFMYAN